MSSWWTINEKERYDIAQTLLLSNFYIRKITNTVQCLIHAFSEPTPVRSSPFGMSYRIFLILAGQNGIFKGTNPDPCQNGGNHDRTVETRLFSWIWRRREPELP